MRLSARTGLLYYCPECRDVYLATNCTIQDRTRVFLGVLLVRIMGRLCTTMCDSLAHLDMRFRALDFTAPGRLFGFHVLGCVVALIHVGHD